jgi:hypothetical protein
MPAAKQNIENNPMQSSMVSLAWMFSAIPRKIFLTRRANQPHYCIITQFETPSPSRSPKKGAHGHCRAG